MYNVALRIMPEVIRSLAFGSTGASYVAIGDALEHPSRILIINNLTNATMMFSFDGINDHIALSGPGSFTFDVSANSAKNSGAYIAQGTTIYTKRVGTPSSGSVYIMSFYASDGR